MARKKSGNKLPPFVPLTWDLLNSEAYKQLPPSAAKALPYFIGKVKMPWKDIERCSTEFTFSYPEAKRLGFSPATFSKVQRDLRKMGFLDIIERGGLRGHGKGYNRFKLSLRWESFCDKG